VPRRGGVGTIPPLRIPRKRRAECSGRDDRFSLWRSYVPRRVDMIGEAGIKLGLSGDGGI